MEVDKTYDYASFGQRFAAILIDALILGTVMGILFFIFGALFMSTGGAETLANIENIDETAIITMVMSYLAFFLLTTVAGWLYFALQESSAKMATIGKKAMGIVVTDMDGERITFMRATGRFFGKWVSGAIMYIGYIMAAFTEKKQALHDMMANCLVMKDN